MTTILERLGRWMPVFFAITALLALVQLVALAMSLLGKATRGSWLGAHAAAITGLLGALSLVGLLLAVLSVAREADRLPPWLMRRSWLMDILDRLSNRPEIERQLEKPVEAQVIDAEVIDAEVLAATLRGKVVGQDAICGDVAAQIRRRLAMEHRHRPIGVFLLAGPPGSGKTYLGKVLADALGRRLIHFDMTQFSSPTFAATSRSAPGKATSARRATGS